MHAKTKATFQIKLCKLM